MHHVVCNSARLQVGAEQVVHSGRFSEHDDTKTRAELQLRQLNVDLHLVTQLIEVVIITAGV